jgi:hypothetical protein
MSKLEANHTCLTLWSKRILVIHCHIYLFGINSRIFSMIHIRILFFGRIILTNRYD